MPLLKNSPLYGVGRFACEGDLLFSTVAWFRPAWHWLFQTPSWHYRAAPSFTPSPDSDESGIVSLSRGWAAVRVEPLGLLCS